jgi:hypothetical protein
MNDGWKEIDRYLEHRGLRVGQPTLGRTTGGRHASGPGHYSFHYEGLARDYSVFDSDASMIARKLEFIASDPNGPIAELFYAPLDIWYKDGQHLKSGAMRGRAKSPFTLGVGGHQDHCHVALKRFRRLF